MEKAHVLVPRGTKTIKNGMFQMCVFLQLFFGLGNWFKRERSCRLKRWNRNFKPNNIGCKRVGHISDQVLEVYPSRLPENISYMLSHLAHMHTAMHASNPNEKCAVPKPIFIHALLHQPLSIHVSPTPLLTAPRQSGTNGHDLCV